MKNNNQQHSSNHQSVKSNQKVISSRFDVKLLKLLGNIFKPASLTLLIGLSLSLYVNFYVPPTWVEQKSTFQVTENETGKKFYIQGGKKKMLGSVVPYDESQLSQTSLNSIEGKPELKEQWVFESIQIEGSNVNRYSLLEAKFHFGIWSLLPAFLAIFLCLLTKEPLTALFSGILAAAFMLGRFDITNSILIPSMATTGSAGVILLYLWLLGGLMGVWSKTGAAEAFATYMTKHFVRGPRTAKLVAWALGVLFFQGGTVSTVLVGTAVKSVADKENISHEELSYIVDSTAAPIAIVIAFNAWPAYVQALIFVPGATFLSTEAERMNFFFSSIPYSFYSIIAVIGTLLLSLNITRFSGKGIRDAQKRAQEKGLLDAIGSNPLVSKEFHTSSVPKEYNPNVLEFIVPLSLLIIIAISTYLYMGSPQVHWAFSAALVLSALTALIKGMTLGDLIEGFGDGLKGVVVASILIILAITVGTLSKEIGGGLYLIESLGSFLPFWILPVSLQVLTMIIAFSTGSSWGTYAVTFPLAMPLAWAVCQSNAIAQPELFMMICFAAVLNGSIFGDQCSPISDTTILSATATGCDLMDHVKTQFVPAIFAAILAGFMWTIIALFIV